MEWWEGVDEARVLVTPDYSTRGSGVRHFLALRHPKAGNTACYLHVDESLLELHWFKQSYGSWFLGDYVCEDGRLYIATQVDPVFILLPIFEEARMKKGDDLGKFRQLDEIIYIDGYPGYQQLASLAEKSMEVVCDVKEIDSTKFFRLNDSKVLKWLQYKVHQLLPTLLTLDKNYAAQNTKDTLIGAVSIVGEYLKEEPWLKLLCEELKVSLQEVVKAPNSNILSLPTESDLPSFNTTEEKIGTEKKTAKVGRVGKKAKVEIESKNIKDMFSRASRRGK